MKQIKDKLKEKMKGNKRLLLFLVGVALIGLICGSIFMTILSVSDQSLVKNYIENFSNTVMQGKLNYIDAIKNTLCSNLSFSGIIWLLGISIIGIPIVIFMYFTKTFMIGFSVGAFIIEYSWKGIIYAIVYIFPHHLINLLAYTLLMIYSIKFSLSLLDSIIHKRNIHLKPIMNQYIGILVIVVVAICLTALYETFAVPYFLKLLFRILK